MRWRGCHLDVARRFYSARGDRAVPRASSRGTSSTSSTGTSATTRPGASRSRPIPQLTEKAAWRGHGLADPAAARQRARALPAATTARTPSATSSPSPHSSASTSSPRSTCPATATPCCRPCPQLRDPGENGLYHSIQSFPNNCLNPGVEAVYPALETIFGELIELFPVAVLPRRRRRSAGRCLGDLARGQGAAARTGTAAPLQAHFLQRIQAFLTGKGKITGRLGRGGAGRRHRQGQLLPRRLAHGRSQPEARRRGLRRRRRAGAGLLPRHGATARTGTNAAPAGPAGRRSEKTYRFEPAAGWSAAETREAAWASRPASGPSR